MAVGIAVFSHMLAAGDARALSCRIPDSHGFFECDHGRCEPLFQARFRLTGDGCRGRWITEPIESDVAAWILGEVDRRSLRVDGLLDVEFSLSTFRFARAMPGEEWVLEAYVQEMKIGTVPGSPAELRETWDAKASEGFWAMVRAESIGWAWALVLFALLYVTGRRVWSAFRRSEGRRDAVALALTVQALGLSFAWFAVSSAQAMWSDRLAPVGLVVLLGAALFIVELLALTVKRLRGASQSV
jgi:hypothetical protein